MPKMNPLDPEALMRRCPPELFEFDSTDDLESLEEIVGQERAVSALRFGIGIQREGFNIFALGPPGTGKQFVVKRLLEERAAGQPKPFDYCYVNNFEEPHKPRALPLPAGWGVRLRSDMERLVEDLRSAIPSAFETDEYRRRRQVIEEEAKEEHDKAFGELEQAAEGKGFKLMRTPLGFIFAPLRKGQVLGPDEFEKLPEAEQQRIQTEIRELQRRLQATIQQIPRWAREARERVKKLDHETTLFAVGHLIDDLRHNYAELPEVVRYLDAVEKNVVQNAADFLQPAEGPSPLPAAVAFLGAAPALPSLARYRVNVLVDHSASEGLPVLYEDNPTHANLVGRVEHIAQMGALVTDFNLIKPGKLHLANGGYLILEAAKVLQQPYAWEGLKRALRSRQIQIESLGQALSLISTVSLEPEPIPLDVKTVLIGPRLLYYLLCEYDPDFMTQFKVAADFDERMPRTPENSLLYARLVATLARDEGLRAFDRGAVCRVVEHGARLTGSATKLSAEVQRVLDLLREADHWARESGSDRVRSEDVQKAIDAQAHRQDRLRERTQEEIRRGTLLIDTTGEKIGQLNGLSVIQLGQFAFGRPSRITARVRMGKGEVVDIEREVELGGPIHSKGVLILSGYLGARYAPDRLLSLSASLVFEQSYSGVEGDSASSAELYALLSALSGAPVRQSLAVTGSVNQNGEVQAIGAVNEKIEGFFEVCKARGLAEGQGVLIPASNVEDLMLRRDVIEAAEAGKFHIYAVETIDQGIELLTGLPAGERDASGKFPPGSINERVESRLVELAERRETLIGSESGAEEP